MAVVVREATDDDIGAVAHLRWTWDDAADRTGTLDEEGFVAGFVAWWQSHRDRYACVVAVDGGEVIGMGFLATTPRVPNHRNTDRRSADLQSVFVEPTRRGAGVGSRIVETLVARAQSDGCERVSVHSSRGAVSLYERLGFESSRQLLRRSTRP